MSTKAQRIEKIWQRAYEYARSGRFTGYQTIEWALSNEGLYEARSQHDNKRVRDELDEICRVAQAAAAVGLTYMQAVERGRGGHVEASIGSDDGKK